MSEPIIIETPAPPTRERLVLVPPGCPLPILARDATAADLERAGYVTGEMLAEHVRIVWAAGQEAEPVGVAMLRRLKDRAEKAERERDEARRLHSDAEAQVACRNELRAQVAAAEGRFRAAEAERDTLRAELARLTAPGEGSCWACREELGVAHERARQQPEKDRATDEELVDLYRKVYETHGGRTISVSHDDCRRAGVRAVAARVRQERCLVAQAVGMPGGSFTSATIYRHTPFGAAFGVRVNDRYAENKSAAEVPTTLARLLGEVGKC